MRLSEEAWQLASEEERERLSHEIADQLPEGAFRDGVSDAGYPRYVWDGRYFVLVPGAPEATLGFDASAFSPSDSLLAHWGLVRGRYAETWGDTDVVDLIASWTSPRRQVSVAPMVVEVGAMDVSWVTLGADDPRVESLAHQAPNPGMTVELFSSQGQFRLSTQSYEDGNYVTIQEKLHRIQPDIMNEVAAEGLALPSADQWEYLCGAGRGTLFRWGDDCPVQCYPDDARPELLPELFESNAFGLIMARNTSYAYELTSAPTLKLGGDGGNRVCASVPFFLVWLVLAPSFRETWYRQTEEIAMALRRRVCVVE